MNILGYILWNPDVVAFSLGPVEVRWYSLCWCLGLLAVYQLMHYLFKEQKLGEDKFEPMFIYCFLGILIGARLGHCLFYEPEYYLSRPMEMLLPMRKFADGEWHFTGYEGLASHGGTFGLMLAIILYSRKVKLNLMHILDNVAIVTPICAFAIRMGNLMNSEIIGRPTDVPWAFIFERVDTLPRHPGQLYEAICYFIFFFIDWKKRPYTTSSLCRNVCTVVSYSAAVTGPSGIIKTLKSIHNILKNRQSVIQLIVIIKPLFRSNNLLNISYPL